jgi:hypothetical protein
MVAIPSSIALRVVLGDFYIYVLFLSSIPTGRNQGTLGPANVRAMEYPIHENSLRRLLTRHIPLIHCHYAVFEMVWLHLLFVRGLYHVPSLVVQKCGLQCVSRFCATLYTQTHTHTQSDTSANE